MRHPCLSSSRTKSFAFSKLDIENNKELRIASEKEQTAYHRRKAALTNYLPKISAAGAYMHTSDELSLLSDE